MARCFMSPIGCLLLASIVICAQAQNIQYLAGPVPSETLGLNEDSNTTRILNQLLANYNSTQGQVSMDLVRLAWSTFDARNRQRIQAEVAWMRPYLAELMKGSSFASVAVNYDCGTSLKSWLDGLEKLDYWAYGMWNAWGKLPPVGFFRNIHLDEGSYESCRRLNLTSRPHLMGTKFSIDSKNGNTSAALGAKLTTGLFKDLSMRASLMNFQKLSIGSCWPASCKDRDIKAIVKLAALRASLVLDPIQCLRQDYSYQLGQLEIYFLWIVAGFSVLTLLATLADYLMARVQSELDELEYQDSLLNQYINLFSMRRNLFRLFDVRVRTEDNLEVVVCGRVNAGQDWSSHLNLIERLSCLDGFRLVSMLWIIYTQTLASYERNPFMLIYQRLGDLGASLYLLPFMNPGLAVDSFYLIAGCLAGYTIFCSGPFKWNRAAYTMAKYLTMSPLLVIVIFLFLILPAIDNTTLYWQFGLDQARWPESYWSTWTRTCKGGFQLLLGQPMVTRDAICLSPLLWLPLEFGFLLVGLLLMRAFYYKPKLGKLLNVGLVLISQMIQIHFRYATLKTGRQANLPVLLAEYEQNSTIGLLHRPIIHSTAFFIGIGLANSIIEHLKQRGPMSRPPLCLSSSLCGLSLVFCLWLNHYLDLWLAPQPAGYLSFYLYGLTKLWFPMAIGWLIYVCVLGSGARLNYILAHENMKYMAKLIDTIFVSHMLVIYVQSGTFKRDFEPYTLNLLFMCVANSFLCFLLAILLALLFESPLQNLYRLMLGREYERLDNFERQHGLGVTIFHHRKTKINYYRNTLFRDVPNVNHHFSQLRGRRTPTTGATKESEPEVTPAQASS